MEIETLNYGENVNEIWLEQSLQECAGELVDKEHNRKNYIASGKCLKMPSSIALANGSRRSSGLYTIKFPNPHATIRRIVSCSHINLFHTSRTADLIHEFHADLDESKHL